MGWNERSDPDMRTANFKFSCDVYREGVYTDGRVALVEKNWLNLSDDTAHFSVTEIKHENPLHTVDARLCSRTALSRTVLRDRQLVQSCSIHTARVFWECGCESWKFTGVSSVTECGCHILK